MLPADYLCKLIEAIRATHGAEARHVATEPVTEIFEGELAWTGLVEVFEITNHPKAKRCYAWGYVEGGMLRSTAVLEIPPVDSASSAVTIAIASKGKSQRDK